MGCGVVLGGWKIVVGWQEMGEDMGAVVVAGGGTKWRWRWVENSEDGATVLCFCWLVWDRERE